MVRTPPATQNCEANLINRRKQSPPVRANKKENSLRPESFVLCERSSGAVRFRVDADADGGLPVEHVAGLLAMHCLVGGQMPEDFEVMVVARGSLLQAVSERAEQLLAAGRAIATGVKISRREKEVLDGVLQNLANKEIANKLNLSERTVKFHVSSLLSKFHVSDRVALCREVIMGRVPAGLNIKRTLSQTLFGIPVSSAADSNSKAIPIPDSIQAEAPRRRGQVLPLFRQQRFAT
jgi:DNA-binding CsgD family transcriptional regulator